MAINVFQTKDTSIVLSHVTSIKKYGNETCEVRLTNGDGVIVSTAERDAIVELLSPSQSVMTLAAVSTEGTQPRPQDSGGIVKS